jgi:cation diffusion facilitator family transporter
MPSEQESSYKLRTLKISAIAITSVVLVEVVLGLAVGSLAILSDGAHALLDALTAIVLLMAIRASLKPPDEEHMYGHEKIESVGGLVGGIVLIGVAVLLIFEAVQRIMENRAYINTGLEFAGFISIGYTFFIDFLRVGTFRKATKSESSTIKAGFYHALADLGSTALALVGFGLATLGFYNGDSIASIILGFVLTFFSVKLIWTSGMELSDTISKDVVRLVRREISRSKGVCDYENLKVRKSGDKFFIEATLKAPDYMNLEEAHETTTKIEANIKKRLGNVETTFHIEPVGTQEMPTKKLVEKLATEVGGVKEAHEIDTAYTEDKLYITLHARVDPRLTVQEAHEIAEKIENSVKNRIGNVENVTVHIEPYDAKVQRGSAVDEDEIREIIHKIAKDYEQVFRIRRIVTYVADGKRYISIDCSFSEKTAVEDAHKLVSHIEEMVRRRFEESVVTVHTEPEKKKRDSV